MTWGFETEPEFQEKLDWVRTFVDEKIEPLSVALEAKDIDFKVFWEQRQVLKQEVRDRDLWACHLDPELGGKGYGQVKLGLLNEILGRSAMAPGIFGAQAPDSGNAETIAHYGTDEQKDKWLWPLLDGKVYSAFSMTEPHSGDPTLFKTRAERVDDGWVINGEKWFTSNAQNANFLIVYAVTNPEVSAYDGTSMFIVPTDTEGVEIVRNVGVGTEPIGKGNHAYVRYTDARIPAGNLLGPEGKAFAVAQTRLSGGRIHHAMRSVGILKKCFDMMCERAVSRKSRTKDGGEPELLARKQMVQERIADSWTEIEMFRLLVLQTAWKIDKYKDYMKVRKDIAAVKARLPKVLIDVVHRAMHLHGAIGVSNEMPFARYWMSAPTMGIADGATEVHKETVARQVLRDYDAQEGIWPSEHIFLRRERARELLSDIIETEVLENA